MDNQRTPQTHTVHQVFADPVVQLAALCPICALAALSPTAALAALSPTLLAFNPAVSPQAALAAFVGSNPRGTISYLTGVRVGMRTAELKVRRGLIGFRMY